MATDSKIVKPKACLVCRQRKIKCDAHTKEGGRCSNCILANVTHCIIPRPKKRESKKLKQILSSHPELINPPHENAFDNKEDDGVTNLIHLNPSHMLKGKLDIISKTENHSGFIAIPITPQLLIDFIKVHPEKFPEYFSIDPVDLNYLKALNCFTLPNIETCNKYIDIYFTLVNTQFPIINEHQFRTDYCNIQNGDFPSLLLLQSIIYIGSFFYDEPNWTEKQLHEQKLQSKRYYKIAKALLDFGIEVDPLCQIQSELIMNKYWYTVTSFKTTGFAYIASNIAKAHSMGMQKDQTNNKILSTIEKRLYKRIWWSLYIKDCFMSNLVGRPYFIDDRTITVSIIQPEDMLDIETSDQKCPLSGLFFIHRVKLIIGFRLIIKNIKKIERKQFSVGESIESLLQECDQFLLTWIRALPKELLFHTEGKEKNSIMSATLAIEYYSLLLIVHKVHIFQIQPNNDIKVSYPYSSWAITFKSCHMISIIGKYFQTTGAIFLYPSTTCSFVTFAGAMLMYQMYNQDETVVELARNGIENCISVLGSLQVGWPFASLLHFYLKSFYENKDKRGIIIKKMLRHGSRSQLHSQNSINSNRTMHILNDIRILPKILPTDNSKSKPAFVQNIFKSNQVLNPNDDIKTNNQHLWQLPIPNISPLPLSKTLGISLSNERNYRPSQNYGKIPSPDVSLRDAQTGAALFSASPSPQPVSSLHYLSPTLRPNSHESDTNLTAIMRTFDEVIPSNTLPNLTGSEWHPNLADMANKSDNSRDMYSGSEETTGNNIYLDEFTLFSKLGGGAGYGDIINDMEFIA